MRVFGALVVTLLLAGCTFGGSSPREEPGPASGTPGAVPTDGVPATSGAPGDLPGEPCLALTLTPHPEVFAVGERVSLVATVSNCGGEEYVLLKPGRCTLARSLAVGIEEGNRTYWLVDRDGPPVDEEMYVGSHGPCGVGDVTEAVLPPLGRWGMELGFNGTVQRAVREVNETAAGRSVRTWTEPAKLAPGWHRVFLHLHAMDGSREWTLNRSVYVVPTRDNPDPDVAPRPGMSLWLPTPPPADAPRRPDGPEEFARRNAEQGPREAPEAVLEAGRRLLREWTGAFAVNYTLAQVMHQSMEAFCSNGSERCDRWGWMDYYVLQYEVRFPVDGNASFALSFPVRSDGVALDEDVWGVPDCVRGPRECVVTVDAREAMRRAREEGLGNGTMQWRVEFTWHREYEYLDADVRAGVGVPPRVHGTFAWSVRNSTDEGDTSGHVVVIDANDGRLVGRDQWSRGFP